MNKKTEPDWLDAYAIQHPKKNKMLRAFAAVGMVAEAARIAEVDRTMHYDWLKADEVYAKAFDHAHEIAGELAEDELTRRGIHGVEKPVYQQGELVGHVVEYSDACLIFKLKGLKPQKYRERYEHSGPNGAPLPTPETHVHLTFDMSKLKDDELELYRKVVARGATEPASGPPGGGR
jgi:hypothetical protein